MHASPTAAVNRRLVGGGLMFSWQTAPLPRRTTLINSPQWVQLDIGPENRFLPTGERSEAAGFGSRVARSVDTHHVVTGLRIVCDLQNAKPHLREFRRCPRAFRLLAAVNETAWEVLVVREHLESEDFSVDGALFRIPEETPGVRPLHYRCGSCDRSVTAWIRA